MHMVLNERSELQELDDFAFSFPVCKFISLAKNLDRFFRFWWNLTEMFLRNSCICFVNLYWTSVQLYIDTHFSMINNYRWSFLFGTISSHYISSPFSFWVIITTCYEMVKLWNGKKSNFYQATLYYVHL